MQCARVCQSDIPAMRSSGESLPKQTRTEKSSSHLALFVTPNKLRELRHGHGTHLHCASRPELIQFGLAERVAMVGIHLWEE